MKPVDATSAWSSQSDVGKKESDGLDPPQGVALEPMVVKLGLSSMATDETATVNV